MKILKVKPTTMGEAKEIIARREKDREMSYEQKLASDHLKKFTRLDSKKSKQLLKDLNSVLRMSLETAVQIVNILPDTPDELRMIFAREKFSLKDEEIKQILEVVKKYK